MNKKFEEYKASILKLPLKEKYTKEELLIDDLLVDKEGKLEIYYAPHNEHLNSEAKVLIVGITPGFQQMSTAISMAKRELEKGSDDETVLYKCKVSGRFSGSLRKNLIQMLDEIMLNKALKINSCSELFEDKDYLLHTVSLIPYAVFVKKQNYTGHTPKLIKNDFLMKYVYDNFIVEFKELKDKENVLIIPLGKAVEEVLDKLVEEKIITNEQVLKGFPHPSGANVNRLIQLEEFKINFKERRVYTPIFKNL